MNSRKLILLTAFVAFSMNTMAQKIVKISGDIKTIAGESKLNLKYDYSDFMVGKFSSEKAYIDDKKATISKKDGQAKADEWEAGWEKAKGARFEPKFQELINDQAKGVLEISPENKDAKYTLTLKTTFIEPGFNVGVMKQPAYINVEYIVTETANPSTVVAKYSASKIPGSQAMGYDFDAGSRIAESYAKAGKSFGGFMKKNLAVKK